MNTTILLVLFILSPKDNLANYKKIFKELKKQNITFKTLTTKSTLATKTSEEIQNAIVSIRSQEKWSNQTVSVIASENSANSVIEYTNLSTQTYRLIDTVILLSPTLKETIQFAMGIRFYVVNPKNDFKTLCSERCHVISSAQEKDIVDLLWKK